MTLDFGRRVEVTLRLNGRARTTQITAAVLAAAREPVVEGPVVEGPVVEGPVVEGRADR